MIRAAIGRFVLACIRAARVREFEQRASNFSDLSDQQISDFIHGRAIDLTAAARRGRARS